MNRRAFLKYSLRGLVVATLGKGYYNAGAAQVELVRVLIKIRQLPVALHGLKIGLLTDFHASSIVSEELIKAAADLVMSERPDLIALTGDFVSGATKFLSGSIGTFHLQYLERCAVALSRLTAPLGIYGVLGNHDFWSGSTSVKAICDTLNKRVGVIWLRNANIELKKAGESFHLLGVDDYWESSCSLTAACKGVNRDSIKILLSHNPDINDDIASVKERIDLVLSGHTHGGQVVAPFLGQPVIPSKFGQKYRQGLIRDGERQTYVSRGIGCLLVPIRLNCMPEATVLTLN